MLTQEEIQALNTLEDVSLRAALHPKRRTDSPGQFIMNCSSETREKLKNLTSRATQSLRPDGVII